LAVDGDVHSGKVVKTGEAAHIDGLAMGVEHAQPSGGDAAHASATPVTRIGRITPSGLRVQDPQGQAIDVRALSSFDHFA
jgi:hypothetical protein